MENEKIVFKGQYPEIEIKDMHFCGIRGCPTDDLTVFVGFDISCNKKELGDTITNLLKFKKTMENCEDDEIWKISIERSK
jgi:hypothetical protein